jgi:uncharacterized BrkB/YihY/UPF0761 family membrane protein
MRYDYDNSRLDYQLRNRSILDVSDLAEKPKSNPMHDYFLNVFIILGGLIVVAAAMLLLVGTIIGIGWFLAMVDQDFNTGQTFSGWVKIGGSILVFVLILAFFFTRDERKKGW